MEMEKKRERNRLIREKTDNKMMKGTKIGTGTETGLYCH